MAATEPNPRAQPGRPGVPEPLAPAELQRRLEEEIGRAERHGTKLSCLLVVVENLAELARELPGASEHGGDFSAQTIDYIAAALGPELRRFDRLALPSSSELAIVLPGADGPSGEMVARRILDRVQAIKVESQGTRRPLELSVGLAAWRTEMTPQDLLARARAAAARQNGELPLAPLEIRADAAEQARAADPGRTDISGPPAFGHTPGS